MRMLSGILAHDDGQARLWGFDTVRQTRQMKEHLGYLPQSFGLYDDLTVRRTCFFSAVFTDCRPPEAGDVPKNC